jgi:putative toxin-antitoxin system antitoxin component (TIGR02293 family)
MAMPRASIERVSELLGGRRVLGALTRILGISVDAASAWLRLPRRTLARRKEDNRLDPQQSERVLRLAEMTARAMGTFGSVKEAMRWLFTENRALGGVVPVALLDTDMGTRAAQDALLQRLQRRV